MLKKTWKKSYHWVLGKWVLLGLTHPTNNITTSSPTKFPQHSPIPTRALHFYGIETEEGSNKSTRAKTKSLHYFGKRTLAKNTVLRESPNSMGTSSKHVVIVMDALKEFSYETLQWALDHVIGTGYTVTLLGVMPWLNLPLSCKTWLDVWTLDLEDLPSLRERSEWMNDAKYQKVRAIIELCDKYGVVPHMKVAMGYPLRLVVLEQTTSLHATWVVFDRHHRKNRAFYAKRIPCNVVMMNSDGEMDILNKLPMIDKGDNTPGDSPAVVPIIPRVIISEELMGILRPIREESTEEELNVDEEQGNT